MSYVSPIKIFYAEEPEEGWTDKIGKYLAGEVDNLVLQSCVKVGCHVDKDELEKALRYDRGQYEKGYEDGKRDAAAAIEDLQAEVKRLEPKREEIWKDVIGYEGLYQVSDQARVRNNKGKILKQSVKVGKCVYYKYVKLYKDGQYRQGYVHRMMAECFIPNPDNLPIINHKDEDGTNNRLDNLEWCTVEYNSNYGNAKRNMSRGKRRRAKMEVQE